MKLGPVQTVKEHGNPTCSDEKLFLGINSNGFMAVFNEYLPESGLCFYDTADSSDAQMDCLVSYQEILD